MNYNPPTVFVNSTLQHTNPYRESKTPWRGPVLDIQIDLPDYEWDTSVTKYDLELLRQVILMDSRWEAMVGEIFDRRMQAYIGVLIEEKLAELVRFGLLHCWNNKWYFDPQDAADKELYSELKRGWPEVNIVEEPEGRFLYSFFEAGTEVLLGYGQLHNGPIIAGPDEEPLYQRVYVNVVDAGEDALVSSR